MKTKSFFLSLFLLTAINLMAYDFKYGDLYYNITSDSTVEVTGTGEDYSYNDYYRELTSINIPASVTYDGKNYSVTSIRNGVFADCSRLTSITVPSTVTSIGNKAFDSTPWYDDLPNGVVYINSVLYEYKGKMPQWTDIVVKEGTISISPYAFDRCENLYSVTLPNTITSIGEFAFSDCTGLTSVYMPNVAMTIGGRAFSGCSNLSSITLPNGVTIGWGTFMDCTGLTSITIPQNTQSIGYNAFGGTNIETITIESAELNEIGSNVFTSWTTGNTAPLSKIIWNVSGTNTTAPTDLWYNYNWKEESSYDIRSQITSVEFGDSVSYIPEGLCENFSNLTSITISEGIQSIGSYVFYNCSNLKSIVWNAKDCNDDPFHSVSSQIESFQFGYRVQQIPDRLCSDMEKITNIHIPNSVKFIGDKAFEGCKELKSITIPNSVTVIGDKAFAGCKKLESLTLSKNATKIGKLIITGCNNMQAVVVERGNPVYDSRNNCNAIIETATNTLIAGCRNTIIPNTVDTIGIGAFCRCDSLKTITIPKGVRTIVSGAFSYCTNLSSVIIEDGIEIIEGFNFDPAEAIYGYSEALGAFYGCTNLSSINFPNSITKIGYGAFADCTRLDSITLPSGIKEWGAYTFAADSLLSSVKISNGITYIPDGAFGGCTNLAGITIPNSVTKIGAEAFIECSCLRTITIPQNVTSIGMSTFVGCSALTSVICYAIEPPTISRYLVRYNGDTIYYYDDDYIDPFDGLPTIPLYVPAESVEKYKQAECWKDFIVLPLSAKPANVDEPILNPSDNNVEIIWPQDPSATTYTIDICKDGELVCSLVFDANGVLQSIRFSAPSRSQESTTAQAQATNNGFSFVVEGLESGTTYHYTINAQNSAGNILQTYSGTFKTTGVEMGMNDAGMNQTPTKFIRDGKVVIRQGDKHYTTTGIELE